MFTIENTYFQLLNYVELIIDYLLSFEKRTSILYLISSSILALFAYNTTTKKDSFIGYLLNKKVWWSTSAKTDYALIFFNTIIKIIIITPMLSIGLKTQFFINQFLKNLEFPTMENHFWLIIFLYTFFIWILNDLGTFIIHFLFHKISFLWEFHKIHHSATTMNPLTLYRIHPVELIINNLKSIFIYGFVTGIFYYLASGEVGTITFVGVNIFTFLFMFFGANLRHSHVKFKFYSFLETIFISPFQHQIHHSDNPSHFNKNLGSNLAIWDCLFGSLIKSKEVSKIKFGIGKKENSNYNSIFKTIFTPFKNLFFKNEKEQSN